MNQPTFILIGAAKSGTSSFYNYVKQHPSVYVSPVAKTNFFVSDFVDGKARIEDLDFTPKQITKLNFPVTTLEAYQQLFEDIPAGKTALGEISPMYLNSFVAAKKLKSSNPNVKLIAMLRNPVDRAYSGYQMQLRQTEEQRDFASNLDQEEIYIRGGFYYEQLKRFFDVFERDQIKIFLFEDFKQNPHQVIQEMFDFIGVDDSFVPDLGTKFNQGGVPKNKGLYGLLFNSSLTAIAKKTITPLLPLKIRNKLESNLKNNLLSKPKPMTLETRSTLQKIYQEDIVKLEKLINRDLQQWLN
jgi:hypothetical protein